MAAFWLLKTEPGDYSWEDLQQQGETFWDGVKSPGAQKNIRSIQPGDLAFIYHTGKFRSLVGIARITSRPYTMENSSTPGFDLVPLNSLPRVITLREIKNRGVFPDWDLIRLPRLSVVPVSPEQWDAIITWSRESPIEHE